MTVSDRDYSQQQRDRLQDELRDERLQQSRNQDRASVLLVIVAATAFWVWALWVWAA